MKTRKLTKTYDEKRETLKKIDALTMEIWNHKALSNEEKNSIVMRLQEIQMILQEGRLP